MVVVVVVNLSSSKVLFLMVKKGFLKSHQTNQVNLFEPPALRSSLVPSKDSIQCGHIGCGPFGREFASDTRVPDSVTRLGDLLDFGLVFKAFGNN